jgi:hypothetical protein
MSRKDDLDEHEDMFEDAFGLVSGWCLFALHEMSTAAGSQWDYSDPSTMEIVVTKENAEAIYAYCKEIRSGYSVGLKKSGMAKIKAARAEAHKYLVDEANDPETSIDRKIVLVRLTSK